MPDWLVNSTPPCEDYCPRKELLAMDRDPAIEVFKAAVGG